MPAPFAFQMKLSFTVAMAAFAAYTSQPVQAATLYSLAEADEDWEDVPDMLAEVNTTTDNETDVELFAEETTEERRRRLERERREKERRAAAKPKPLTHTE